jgi:hypothetical protein
MNDPAVLFDALNHNRTGLTQLAFRVADQYNIPFNDHCLLCLADCLATNTNLTTLELPGILMCTNATRLQFADDLWQNRALTLLLPRHVFSTRAQAAIQRNRIQQFTFTPEFVLGAAEAFMRLMGTPREIGAVVAAQLAPTPVERVYAGPVMALLCKATHDHAVRLRSACLREALKVHLRNNDAERCRALLISMGHARLDLLPADQADVVALARASERLGLLPSGYAG